MRWSWDPWDVLGLILATLCCVAFQEYGWEVGVALWSWARL